MPTPLDPDLATAYPRSILEAMTAVLDDLQTSVPRVPESHQWAGRAKTQYAVELERLSDALSYLRFQVEQTLEQLAAEASCA